MQTVFIGLDSWIIQDGNYGDFHVGEEACFALEFYAHRISPTTALTQQMTRRIGCRYCCHARYVFVDQQVCVLDFGLLAYCEGHPLADDRTNDWIETDIYLGIDPFSYKERLCNIPGMPPLLYDWRVERIWLETTPWLESRNERRGNIRTRDEAREAFREVTRSDAWNDDDGYAHYILECNRLGGPHC